MKLKNNSYFQKYMLILGILLNCELANFRVDKAVLTLCDNFGNTLYTLINYSFCQWQNKKNTQSLFSYFVDSTI